jgi:TPP-dependent pyruvate/acetoin dehydrogenase alpha subunit
MKEKIYQLYGINTAMHMLRPGARWEISNNEFSVWEDPRPCPTIEEVYETMEKIRTFEESIKTIWREDQIKALKEMGVNASGLPQ